MITKSEQGYIDSISLHLEKLYSLSLTEKFKAMELTANEFNGQLVSVINENKKIVIDNGRLTKSVKTKNYIIAGLLAVITGFAIK